MILTICPTFNRARQCQKMLQSFENTSDSKIVFGLSLNDESLKEYNFINDKHIIHIFSKEFNITNIINSIYTTLACLRWLMLIPQHKAPVPLQRACRPTVDHS